MAELTMVEALNLAMREEMQRDETVFVLGEDVGVDGGIFRVTDGLLDEFGERRVIDTPLAESAIIGFTFQDPGEGIFEAEVLEVKASSGDSVSEGQELLVVETDKAAFEVSSPRSGVIRDVSVTTGDTVQVGQPLLTFEADDEASSEDDGARKADAKASRDDTEPEAARSEAEAEPEAKARGQGDAGEDERQRNDDENGASKRREDEHGEAAAPEGERAGARARPGDADEDGKRDGDARHSETDARAKRDEPLDFSRWGKTESVPLRSVRRSTARHMARAWAEIPHVNHQDLVDITDLEASRRRLAPRVEEHGGKLTLTALALKALVATLREFPRFNASFDARREELILKSYHHVGVAVDTERGLIVPVVRDVGFKSLSELCRELSELSEATRRGKVGREALRGGSFTLTNVGAIGGTSFVPLINSPEVAILGLARADYRATVRGAEGDEPKIEPRLLLPLSLSFDHRVIDRAEAARFLRRFGSYLSDVDAFLLGV